MQVTSPQQNTAESPGANDLLVKSSIPVALRLVYCGLGMGMIGLLVVARMLNPDPSGIGTHQQLGLPPCGFEMAFGTPCPSCGMTTSWALATRGQLIASARTNAGGFLLAVVALPIGLWLAISGFRGQWVLRPPDPLILGGMMAVVIAAAFIQWALRLLQYL